jgi:deoxyribonuclease-4
MPPAGVGYDVRTAESLEGVLAQFDSVVGLDRLGSLHCNDSQTPLGSNRDRHAAVGEGELGRTGCAAWLSEPRFDGLPACSRRGGTHEGVELARTLRAEGQAARSAAPE